MQPEYKIQDNQVVQVEYTEKTTAVSSQQLRDQNAIFEAKIAENNALIAQIETLEPELVPEQTEQASQPEEPTVPEV